MNSSFTTKQFASYIRKLVVDREKYEEWRVGKLEESSNAGEHNMLYGTKGKWFFFDVKYHDFNGKPGGTSTCGVYIGPKRIILVEGCHSIGGGTFGKAHETFERHLRDCLAGK